MYSIVNHTVCKFTLIPCLFLYGNILMNLTEKNEKKLKFNFVLWRTFCL
jgi:hypothetical protein